MLFYKDEKIEIFNEDFIKNTIQENLIDLIVTSPPYNVDMEYDNHDDNADYHTYLEFSENWLSKCYNMLTEEGRICINVPLDKNKGGLRPIYADIVNLAKNIGYIYKTTIVWLENNISRRTAWGSWKSASAPHVIAPVEMILVMYKKNWKKTKGTKISTIERDEFISWTNGSWVFNGENRTKKLGHPAPFPVELPKRCIKLFSYENDIVLDPFLGSGTTAIACMQNNRRFIGFDISSEYCSISSNRIKEEYLINTEGKKYLEGIPNVD